MRLFGSDDSLIFQVHWRGLPPAEDTDESLQNVFENVLGQVKKALKRKNILIDLSKNAQSN